MDKKTRVLIADDHPIFRSGLAQHLESANFVLAGEAEDGAAAIERIRETAPDVAILDVDMPNKDGFEVAREIADKGLSVEVIFLTMHKSESLLNAALNIGVKGFVLKDSAMADITSAIKAVVTGEEFISPASSLQQLR